MSLVLVGTLVEPGYLDTIFVHTLGLLFPCPRCGKEQHEGGLVSFGSGDLGVRYGCRTCGGLFRWTPGRTRTCGPDYIDAAHEIIQAVIEGGMVRCTTCEHEGAGPSVFAWNGNAAEQLAERLRRYFEVNDLQGDLPLEPEDG